MWRGPSVQALPLSVDLAGVGREQRAPVTEESVGAAVEAALAAIAAADDSASLKTVRAEHTGEKSALAQLNAQLRNVPNEQKAALDALPEELKGDPAIAQAQSLLDLSAQAPQDEGELDALRQAAENNPTDMDAQFAFAQAAFAAGQRDVAANALLAMIAAEPEWNEGAAKAKLLQIFEAIGLEDPWVAATRRKLSLLLFG